MYKEFWDDNKKDIADASHAFISDIKIVWIVIAPATDEGLELLAVTNMASPF